MIANLHSDIPVEHRARKVYEELHRHVQDKGARQWFYFLIQLEEAHALLLFERALEQAKALQPGKSFGDK